MVGEGYCSFDFPWFEFGGVGTLAFVVGLEALLEILCEADVIAGGVEF